MSTDNHGGIIFREVSKKRIIILGAGGFIGWWLLKRSLEGQWDEVIGLSRENLDLMSWESVSAVLSSLTMEDVIILAAGIARFRANHFEAMQKNLRMTEHIVEILKLHPVSQLIYLSSVDAYGCLERHVPSKERVLSEATPLHPDDYYGIGKIACEKMFQDHLTRLHIAVSILRLPGVYGPSDQGRSTIGHFIQRITQEGRITIYGDGSNTRDYLYIDDLYQAVAAVIRFRLNDCLNIVSGRSYSLLEIVRMITEQAGCRCDINWKPRMNTDTERIHLMQFDPAKRIRLLPGVQVHDLAWGIKEYLQNIQKTLPRFIPP